ncbi:MAG: LysM peptidoglycan-binding domain-containing protein [Paracoccaceae bacterium]|nr:LysM peptidoglycan-binding domain-containing protein [Paracoccaceae bacterium]
MQYSTSNKFVKIFPFLIVLSVGSCGVLSNLDFDLRGNEYDTSDAVRKAMKTRPLPDSRGIISYATYEVAVARKGDTIKSIADRLGLKSQNIAAYNGMSSLEKLNDGQLISLPNRTDKRKFQLKNSTSNRNEVNVTELASTAIETATSKKKVIKKSTSEQENEPIRHKVSRGETAFTISRLYNVSIRSLADWNGLDSNYTIREGQYLLIPLPRDKIVTEVATVKPGKNSKTPSPPSSAEALPEPIPTENLEITSGKSKSSTRPENIEPSNTGQFSYPVNGKIIRDYVKNKTDGIDISAPEGTPIVAAEKGIVAAITSDTQEVPIIVLKHEGNLLTVYAGIGDIGVKEKEKVLKSQLLGKIRPGNPSFLHFEVRRGFESIDPMDFLD